MFNNLFNIESLFFILVIFEYNVILIIFVFLNEYSVGIISFGY